MSASLSDPLGRSQAEARADARSEARSEAVGPSMPGPAREVGVELCAHLRGIGMWTSAYADFDAWLAAGAPDLLSVAGTEPPPAKLLHSRLRRRTSTLTRAAVTALESATGQGGAPLDSVRYVLVSSLGEIQTTVDILAQLGEPEGPISPTKFHNSVHNTATGYMSIASGNHREATALAGGPHNLGVGLLETLAGLADVGGDAVLIFAEELLPAPFARDDADPTFAIALHLSSEAADRALPEQSGSLAIELRLSNTHDPNTFGPDGRVPAQGVGGVGLPSMVAPLMQLLRAAAGVDRGQASGAPLPLVFGSDPGVESTWAVTLRSLAPRQGRG